MPAEFSLKTTNMKPGEMGVVVRTCTMPNGTYVPGDALGVVVRVVDVVQTDSGPVWRLHNPAEFVALRDYTAQFADGPGTVYRGDTVRVGCIPDAVLQPLRGLPIGSATKVAVPA